MVCMNSLWTGSSFEFGEGESDSGDTCMESNESTDTCSTNSSSSDEGDASCNDE